MPFLSCLNWHETSPNPDGNRFRAARSAELSQDLRDVELRGVVGDTQPSGDLLVPEPVREHFQNLMFARRQALNRCVMVHRFPAPEPAPNLRLREYGQIVCGRNNGGNDFGARSIQRKGCPYGGSDGHCVSIFRKYDNRRAAARQLIGWEASRDDYVHQKRSFAVTRGRRRRLKDFDSFFLAEQIGQVVGPEERISDDGNPNQAALRTFSGCNFATTRLSACCPPR